MARYGRVQQNGHSLRNWDVRILLSRARSFWRAVLRQRSCGPIPTSAQFRVRFSAVTPRCLAHSQVLAGQISRFQGRATTLLGLSVMLPGGLAMHWLAAFT